LHAGSTAEMRDVLRDMGGCCSAARKPQTANCAAAGLGGVGSHAAHMLARSGVGKLRLVDFDQVTLSSLNRHAVATRDDVGKPKVSVCASHFAEFLPMLEIEAVASMFTADDAGRPVHARQNKRGGRG